MYVHSVKLVNFKSIGDYPESEVIIEPDVTAIIGKNESGKSNVIEGLACVDFAKFNPAAFAVDIVNRNSQSGTENSYIITLKPSLVDIEKGITKDTQIRITKGNCDVTGGFLDYYMQNALSNFEAVVNTLDEMGSNPFQIRDQELVSYNNCKKELGQCEQLDLHRRKFSLDFFYSRISKVSASNRNKLKESLETAQDLWLDLLSYFPIFFYRKENKHLSTSYKLTDIEKELKNSSAVEKSLLYDLVKLIGISSDDFILASKTGISAKQETLRRKISRLIDNKINKPFNDFYQTETITLDISFNAGVVSFVVQSEDGEALMLSERSNGLRWYLETFIDAQANDAIGRNVVYLLDEPGTSLHVNAQKELLKLFRHLAGKGNQVVYTTHSPYMLDLTSEGAHRIRAVVKNAEGFTNIYKTAYDARIAPESQQDTLAPIISAIGMNLQDTFGPAKNKINIVTEGMSDYIYLCAMAKVLELDSEKYTILPSVGASNCVNICAILHGWGCRYIAIFDYDKAGVETGGEFLRNDMMFQYKQQYCYLVDVEQEDVDLKTYKKTPYMIEDVFTRDEIKRYCDLTGTSITIGKPLMAKLISNDIEAGTYQLGEECKTNFRILFERIFTYFSDI